MVAQLVRAVNSGARPLRPEQPWKMRVPPVFSFEKSGVSVRVVQPWKVMVPVKFTRAGKTGVPVRPTQFVKLMFAFVRTGKVGWRCSRVSSP
jgi:hypothetical protein